jgi:large subunit ribosomal protein L32
MAVPKKRTGHSAQGHRRSNWKATKPETTKCPNCGATVLTHTVCTACGTYKGQPVSLKDRKEVTVKEEKPAKKSTKKAEKAEETVEKTEEKAEKKTTKTAAKTAKKADTAKAKKEEKTEKNSAE